MSNKDLKEKLIESESESESESDSLYDSDSDSSTTDDEIEFNYKKFLDLCEQQLKENIEKSKPEDKIIIDDKFKDELTKIIAIVEMGKD